LRLSILGEQSDPAADRVARMAKAYRFVGTRPGRCRRRRHESAAKIARIVSGSPDPISPAKPRISPSCTVNETSRTAGSRRRFTTFIAARSARPAGEA
jgi:hypothetical protein